MLRIGAKAAHLFVICLALWGSASGRGVSRAHAESNCEPDGHQASGAVYRICMPAADEWNGDWVIYAHGYVAYNEPIAIPEDQLVLPGDFPIPEMVNGLGYAFATTSYSVNGLAVRQGLDDLRDLVKIVRAAHRREGTPGRAYLVGASEGGIITALALEQHADVFDGGLSACGPVGNFYWQLNYWGDVRVLFDYFFPGVLPGSPVEIPQEVIDQWEEVYRPRIEAALRGAPSHLSQLLTVAHIPSHPTDAEANIEAVLDLLWYNVFATNDGIAKLGGQPYDNSRRFYFGSDNDRLLNQQVARFSAESAPVDEVNTHYQTSGDLGGPLVTLHTLGDPIVPYWHEWLYRQKIKAHGDEALHVNIPVILRYGHCNISAVHALLGFVWLVFQVTGQPVANAERVLPTAQEQAEFRALSASYGLPTHSAHRLYLPLVVR